MTHEGMDPVDHDVVDDRRTLADYRRANFARSRLAAANAGARDGVPVCAPGKFHRARTFSR